MTDLVCVTGGSGFVAGHVVQQLLDRGHDVRATVRRRDDSAKVRPLQQLATGRPGRLEVVEADLTVDGSFDAAVAGCRVVVHTASPFLMAEQIRDAERDVIAPAVAGTWSVLQSVDRAGTVERVVLTSTVGAMFGDYVDVAGGSPDGVLTEDAVNTTSTPDYNPYHYAKTRAELLAWEWAGRPGTPDLVTVNPGLVLGPTDASSVSGSLFLMDELFRGTFFYGAPGFSFSVVDVREVAAAHVAAVERPDAHGRYILAHREMLSMRDIGRIVRRRHPHQLRVPRHGVPDALVRRIAPRFGLEPRYVAGHLGITFGLDNARGVDELGVRYRPVEQTVLDTYESWRRRRGGSP